MNRRSFLGIAGMVAMPLKRIEGKKSQTKNPLGKLREQIKEVCELMQENYDAHETEKDSQGVLQEKFYRMLVDGIYLKKDEIDPNRETLLIYCIIKYKDRRITQFQINHLFKNPENPEGKSERFIRWVDIEADGLDKKLTPQPGNEAFNDVDTITELNHGKFKHQRMPDLDEEQIRKLNEEYSIFLGNVLASGYLGTKGHRLKNLNITPKSP